MKVINLSDYKVCRHGRKPLFVSHLNGKVRSPDNVGLRNIRSTLERINKLMQELKQLAEREKNER